MVLCRQQGADIALQNEVLAVAALDRSARWDSSSPLPAKA